MVEKLLMIRMCMFLFKVEFFCCLFWVVGGSCFGDVYFLRLVLMVLNIFSWLCRCSMVWLWIW